VHAFCERAALPCLFPNVEVPVKNDRDSYTLYFSNGVLLEAELIASRLADTESGTAAKAVHQIYRAGDNGETAAQALAALLRERGIAVTNHALASGAPGDSVARALGKASSDDAVVLWLRPDDIAALGDPPPARVFVSGLLGGLERAPLPPEWRANTYMAYPVDLPDKRRVRIDFALGWFRIRQIPVVAEQVQADTYLACGLLSETLGHMVDTFIPDYLIESLHDMVEHRIITGYYPRLALAAGQSFASKGGYIVRFAEARGARLVADGRWFVP
jgi:hypothetical protein